MKSLIVAAMTLRPFVRYLKILILYLVFYIYSRTCDSNPLGPPPQLKQHSHFLEMAAALSEIVLVASNREAGGGLAVLEVHRAGGPVCSNFKNCMVDAHCICIVGGGSSYSGLGSGGDFIVASQSKKPVLNVYSWGKPQPHQQCHIQEITTSICCDATGTYLMGGTKKGWLYCWEVGTGQLLSSWQAHFKAVTKVLFSPCCLFVVSCSEDGMVRAWDMAAMLSSEGGGGSSGDKKRSSTVAPYRSWSPHTLCIKDMVVTGNHSSARVITVSLDRTAVVFDLHANKQCFRTATPHPLESVCSSRTWDILFLGSSSGQIFVLDLSTAAVGLSAAHAQVLSTSLAPKSQMGLLAGLDTTFSASASASAGDGSSGSYPSLEGHSRAVTALACSVDNCTLISGSEDGSVRVWDLWTRQCLRESKPLHKAAVTSLVLVSRPELLGSSVHKPALVPLEHLKKYAAEQSSNADFVLPPRISGSFWGRSSLSSTIQESLAVTQGSGGDEGAGTGSGTWTAAVRSTAAGGAGFSSGETHPRSAASSGLGKSQGQGENGGDFLSFSADEPVQQHASVVPRHNDAALGELQRRVEELETENSRWKAVAAGLKRKLEGGSE